MITDFKRPERIQRKFRALCHNRYLFPGNMKFAHTTYEALTVAPPFWKQTVFVFLIGKRFYIQLLLQLLMQIIN
jgi:hypothetical protein